jgi:HK97 family phage prohead protease
MERETRVASVAWPEEDFEVRATSDGLNFRGYAAVFDKWSEDLGGFREKIAPGAFTRTLAEKGRAKRNPIKMFLNHDWNVVLASTTGDTLRLSEDKRGLLVDADLPDNVWGHPVRDAIVRGDISTMSFGFNVAHAPGGKRLAEEWNETHTERTLLDIKLYEVSPITAWPAYPDTTASVRRLAGLIDAPEDELESAVRLLFVEDGELSDAQHDLLMRAINARTTRHYVPSETADLLARLLAKRPAA